MFCASLRTCCFPKGVACFWLEEYETAKAAFLSGMAISKNPERYRTWIRKCDAEVEVIVCSLWASRPVKRIVHELAWPYP